MRLAEATARMALWRVALPFMRRRLSLECLVVRTASPRSRPRDTEAEQLAVRVAGSLWRSSDGPCLERSLALHRQLGWLGADPVLVAAMAHEDGSLVGHAWVELDGRALLEPGDPRERWTALVEFGPDGRRRD